jgi:IMP dehydrogenase
MRFVDANYIEYTPRKWLTFDDVLLLPNRSDVPSRNSEKLDLSSHFTSGVGMRLPIISANMDTITEGKMAIAMGKAGGQGILHRFYKSKAEWLKDILAVEEAGLLPAFSIGVSKDDVKLVEEILNRLKQPKCVVTVDVAHGHHQLVFDQVRRLALGFANNINVIAGNVCTPEGAAYLVSAGANGVKVNVGNGSLCTTRLITGHGSPALSTIINIRRALHGMQTNTTLIADGGIRNSGDIVKALAAGADSVMIGSLFAGTNETSGNYYDINHQVFNGNTEDVSGLYKKYRGQSSEEFNEEINKTNVTSEGESQYVPCKGAVADIINNLAGGIRSGLSYAGCYTLKDLFNKSSFIELSNHGFTEGTPHGLKQ